jgi:conjugative transfer region protein (TIGR03750 family)
MLRELPDLSPHRMDRVPVVVMGCSAKEVEFTFGGSFLGGVLLGLMVGLFLGLGIGVTVGSVIFLGGAFGGLKFLAVIKRGKPDGYYLQQMQMYKQNIGFGRAPFIYKADHYDGFRTALSGDK